MDNQILDLAQKLGKSIHESPQASALRAAQKELDAHKDVLDVLKTYQDQLNKVQQLEQYGVRVSKRLPHLLPPNAHNRFYLETKALRSGHYIDFTGLPRLQEQSDPVRLEGMTE